MAGCGCGQDVSIQNIYNTNINTQILIQNLRNQWIVALFVATTAFYLVPDDFDADPGDAGDEITDRTRALCLITQSWIDNTMNQGLQSVRAGLGDVNTGSGILGRLPQVFTWVIAGAFSIAAFVLDQLVEQLLDTAYRDYLACAMFEELQGKDVNVVANFTSALDNLPSRPPPPETAAENIARDAIESWLRGQLNSTDNYLGFVSQLNSAMEISGTLTDDDCNCTAEWSHTFDFTIDAQGWENDNERCAANWWAFYTAGVGWQQTGAGKSLRIRFPMTASGTFLTAAQLSVGNTVKIQMVASSDPGCVLLFNTSDDMPKTGGTRAFVGGMSSGNFLHHDLQQGASGLLTCSQITFTGTGINPFL